MNCTPIWYFTKRPANEFDIRLFNRHCLGSACQMVVFNECTYTLLTI